MEIGVRRLTATTEARLHAGRATLERTGTPERVAAILQQMITEGEFPPGSRLPEPALCTALAVSRNTLRESFRYLVRDRLVTHEFNRGVFVRAPSLEDITELYQCRRVIECAALRQYDGNPASLQAMQDAIAAADDARGAEDWTAVGTADIRFHRAVTALAGSARITDTMEQVWAELRLAFLTLGDPRGFHEPYIERNRSLIAHMENGKVAVAEEELTAYLSEAEAHVAEAYRSTVSAR